MLVEIKARKAHHITVIGKCCTLSSPKLGYIIYYINAKDVISFRKPPLFIIIFLFSLLFFGIILWHFGIIMYVLNSKPHQT